MLSYTSHLYITPGVSDHHQLDLITEMARVYNHYIKKYNFIIKFLNYELN